MKILNFKFDFRSGNYLKLAKQNDGKKRPLLDSQIQEIFQDNNESKMSDLRFKNLNKTESQKMTSKVL